MNDYTTIGRILNEAGIGFDIVDNENGKYITLDPLIHGGVTSNTSVDDTGVVLQFNENGDILKIIINSYE